MGSKDKGIDEKSGSGSLPSKPQKTSRIIDHITGCDGIIEIRGGPTVTRTRPGYINPLRMNPPTPPEDRSRSPVNDAQSTAVASQNNTTLTCDSPVFSNPNPEMQLLSKEVTEQLESAFHIHDGEASSLPSSPGPQEQGDTGQIEADKTACDGMSCFSADVLKGDLAGFAVGVSGSSPTPSSPTIGQTGYTMPPSSGGVDKKHVYVTSINAFGATQMDGGKDAPEAAAITENRKPELTPNTGSDNHAGNALDVGAPKNPEKKLATWESEEHSNIVGNDNGKEPARFTKAEKTKHPKRLSIGGDRNTSIAKDTESKSVGKCPASKALFRLPQDYMYLDSNPSSNTCGMNEGSKWSSFSSTEKTPSPDAEISPDEVCAGKPFGQRNPSETSISTMAKPLRNASGFFSKNKKDGGNDSKTSSPTFADFSESNPLEYRIELARRCTNTYVEILSPNDTTSPRRINDDRVWYSRNLRCASCEGFCPICESPCCIYKASKEVLAKPKSLQTEMSAHLLQVIEGLGAKVKDMDTFSMCTLGGGCGRRVCPSCCGVCPTELCRDIQCKECKPDPWAVCDWHS